jgi:thiol:disulfide interchange protein DsbA
MNKRLIGVIGLLLALGSAPGVSKELTPAGKEYHEGLHYQRIEPALETRSSEGRVEVVELFLYACPHCNDLEPKLRQWLEGKSEYVELRRVPAIVGPPWADQAKVFYTAQKLGILDKAHEALFRSIHQDGKQYADERSVMEFFISQGIKPEAFFAAYNSPEVTENVSQARVMTVKYGIRGVPAIIVNGKYRTAQYFTGTQEALLEVMDMLVEKERVEMTGSSKSNPQH